jgi:hypothetical protein
VIYKARFDDDDIQCLIGLVGGIVERVEDDGWAKYFFFAGHCIRVLPKEVATGDDIRPYAAVSRPMLEIFDGQPPASGMKSIVSGMGEVERIRLLTTGVSFTFPESLPDTKMEGGHEIPGGVRYDTVFHHPDRLEEMERQAPSLASVELDIGFEIRSSTHRLLIHTNGRSYLTQVALDSQKPQGLPDADRVARRYLP